MNVLFFSQNVKLQTEQAYAFNCDPIISYFPILDQMPTSTVIGTIHIYRSATIPTFPECLSNDITTANTLLVQDITLEDFITNEDLGKTALILKFNPAKWIESAGEKLIIQFIASKIIPDNFPDFSLQSQIISLSAKTQLLGYTKDQFLLNGNTVNCDKLLFYYGPDCYEKTVVIETSEDLDSGTMLLGVDGTIGNINVLSAYNDTGDDMEYWMVPMLFKKKPNPDAYNTLLIRIPRSNIAYGNSITANTQTMHHYANCDSNSWNAEATTDCLPVNLTITDVDGNFDNIDLTNHIIPATMDNTVTIGDIVENIQV